MLNSVDCVYTCLEPPRVFIDTPITVLDYSLTSYDQRSTTGSESSAVCTTYKSNSSSSGPVRVHWDTSSFLRSAGHEFEVKCVEDASSCRLTLSRLLAVTVRYVECVASNDVSDEVVNWTLTFKPREFWVRSFNVVLFGMQIFSKSGNRSLVVNCREIMGLDLPMQC